MLGEEHTDTANSYNVAYNLNAQGKYSEAEEGYRKALAIRRTVLGEARPNTAQSYNNLAYNLKTQGNYRDAETFYLRGAASFAKARLHVAATGIPGAYLVGSGDVPSVRSGCVGFPDGLHGRSRRRARPAIVVNHAK